MKEIKLCYLCQKVKIPKGNQIYCGSYVRKTGCSYIKHLERGREKQKTYYIRHPKIVYERLKTFRKNNPEYQNKYYHNKILK